MSSTTSRRYSFKEIHVLDARPKDGLPASDVKYLLWKFFEIVFRILTQLLLIYKIGNIVDDIIVPENNFSPQSGYFDVSTYLYAAYYLLLQGKTQLVNWILI